MHGTRTNLCGTVTGVTATGDLRFGSLAANTTEQSCVTIWGIAGSSPVTTQNGTAAGFFNHLILKYSKGSVAGSTDARYSNISTFATSLSSMRPAGSIELGIDAFGAYDDMRCPTDNFSPHDSLGRIIREFAKPGAPLLLQGKSSSRHDQARRSVGRPRRSVVSAGVLIN